MLLGLLLAGCRVEMGPAEVRVAEELGGEPTGEVWIYTSMYPTVIDAIDPMIRAKWPGLDPKWYQAGSEKVAQRYETEGASGGSPACLLLTSDPYWYVELAEDGRLQPYLTPNVLQIDRSLVDSEGLWVTARISLMVMAANGTLVAEAERPRRFSDLADAGYRDRFSTADPLASGTMFTTVAFWITDGWPFVEALQANGLVAAGGGSAVISRLETGERPIGVVLLENVLSAARKGSPAVPIYPEDGAIVVPGPIALTAACPNPTGAKAVYDFLLGEEGQAAIVAGDMYAALPSLPAPTGARPLAEIPTRPWKPGFAEDIVRRKGEIKERYAAIVAGP